MHFQSFFSLKSPSTAISFSLLLLLLLPICFFGCYSCSITSITTLLLLVLPTSFPFIFSMIKQRCFPARSMDDSTTNIKLATLVVEEDKMNQEEEEEEEEEERLPLEKENILTVEGNLFASNVEATVCCDRSSSSDCSVSDETSTEISDDESLIEITLKQEEGPNTSDFSTESLFMKHGLMELFSEINEEENMIEIDIAMGSIKCPRFEIKA